MKIMKSPISLNNHPIRKTSNKIVYQLGRRNQNHTSKHKAAKKEKTTPAQPKTNSKKKRKTKNPKDISGAYFGSVEPDQVEGVEVERGVGAIEDGPRAELRGGEARDDDPGELRVVARHLAGAAGEGAEKEESPSETSRAGRRHGGAARLER